MPSHPFGSARSLGSVTVTGITKLYGSGLVLDRVSLSVGPGDRVGVIGPNGVGKSTLLRILAGAEEPDSGRVRRAPKSMTVGYLPQEPDTVAGEDIEHYLARRTGVAEAERAMERRREGMGAGLDAIDAYAEALERFVALGGETFPSRMGAVLDDVGLGRIPVTRLMTELSGGQAARALLGAIVLARFDLLLLDEPTNNLDFDGLARLEKLFEEEPAGIVVVSHDRAFLERSVRRVLELDEGSRRGTECSGGFRAYEVERARRRNQEYTAHDNYVSERERLRELARKQRAWASSGAARAARDDSERDRDIRHGRIQGAQGLASKAKAVERRIERLEPAAKPWEGWDLRMSLRVDRRAGDVVARLHGAEIARGDFLLGPLDLEILWAERIVVTGPNGSGKTTLLGALMGDVALSAGHRYVGPGVVFGRLEQERRLSGDVSLLEGWRALSGLGPSEARSLLAKFGLGPGDVVRAEHTLSPGERTRASLALLVAQGVNCLVLDEPTNHLDLPAIEELEKALAGFDGTILLVTHDRRLLDAFRATRSIAMA